MSRLKPSSRENGRHSHGPKTQAGKDRAKFNAVRHGLLAQQCILLSSEREEAYEDTLHEHIRRFQPQDEVENCLVVEMVHAQWNMFRAFAAETEILDEAQTSSPDWNTPHFVGGGFKTLMFSRSLDLLPRYQARLQLAYQRAIRTLILVRDNFPFDPSLTEETLPEKALPEEVPNPAPGVPETHNVSPTTPSAPARPTTPPPAPAPEPVIPRPVTPEPKAPRVDRPEPDWPKAA